MLAQQGLLRIQDSIYLLATSFQPLETGVVVVDRVVAEYQNIEIKKKSRGEQNVPVPGIEPGASR